VSTRIPRRDLGEIHPADTCCYSGTREGWLDPETWNWLEEFIHVATRAPARRCADYSACIRRARRRAA
jgi:hypothetical protein